MIQQDIIKQFPTYNMKTGYFKKLASGVHVKITSFADCSDCICYHFSVAKKLSNILEKQCFDTVCLNKMYFEWAWSLIHKKIVLFEKTAMRL
jgi:hypothetical protein